MSRVFHNRVSSYIIVSVETPQIYCVAVLKGVSVRQIKQRFDSCRTGVGIPGILEIHGTKSTLRTHRQTRIPERSGALLSASNAARHSNEPIGYDGIRARPAAFRIQSKSARVGGSQLRARGAGR